MQCRPGSSNCSGCYCGNDLLLGVYCGEERNEVLDYYEPHRRERKHVETHSPAQVADQDGRRETLPDLRKAYQSLQDLLRRARALETQTQTSRIKLQALEARS